MKKAELIFVPLPETGHLLSTIEFGKRLINLDSRISMITILSMNLPYAPHADASLASLTASESKIRLISLPEIHDPPPIELLDTSSETYILDFVDLSIPNLRQIIQDLVSSFSGGHVVGLIFDFFCVGLTSRRTLMDGGEGMRKKVKGMADAVKKALMKGGSSSLATARFIKELLDDASC